MDAKKGDWVRIHTVVLKAEDRTADIPEDTKKSDLQMWDKGFLLSESASPGDEVEVETYIGRTIRGTLIEVNPVYTHGYGECVPELFYVGRQAREILEKAGESHE